MKGFHMKRMIAVLAVLAVGCGPDKQDVLTHVSDKVIDTIVGPAVQKALSETSVTGAQLQGGLQGIEPGYKVDVDGYLVQGFRGSIVIRAIGVAGQITGSGQATGKHLPGGNPGHTTEPGAGAQPPADSTPLEVLN